eukprot:6178044-Pleurochrysis_carterae.AAC.2
MKSYTEVVDVIISASPTSVFTMLPSATERRGMTPPISTAPPSTGAIGKVLLGRRFWALLVELFDWQRNNALEPVEDQIFGSTWSIKCGSKPTLRPVGNTIPILHSTVHQTTFSYLMAAMVAYMARMAANGAAAAATRKLHIGQQSAPQAA